MNFEVEISACVFKTQRSRGPPLGWLPGSPDWSRLFGGGAVAISTLKAKGDGAVAPFLRNTLTRALQTHFPPSGATENGRKSNANFQTSMSSAPSTQLQRFRAHIVFASRVRSGAYVEVKRTVLWESLRETRPSLVVSLTGGERSAREGTEGKMVWNGAARGCLLCVLALWLGCPSPPCKARIYTNHWAVRIEGGPDFANQIADKYGYKNLGQVGVFMELPLSKRALQTSCVILGQIGCVFVYFMFWSKLICPLDWFV